MLEVELKSVVDDLARRRVLVERAGGTLTFEGRLIDRRYDTADRTLARRDHVLRVRVYVTSEGERAELDWKGPTRIEQGFKLREEVGTGVTDRVMLARILEQLGYVVTASIDREITQFALSGATVRFERYPRLDDLVEVEGAHEDIERAIASLGMPRDGFTSERLADFVRRYERRTGARAALCEADLARLATSRTTGG